MPRKIDLYWFMPALVNSRVGSESGTTEDEGTDMAAGQYQICEPPCEPNPPKVCPFFLK